MVRSMTGFGHADGPVGGTTTSVEIRTVNHRFFSPSLKLPPAWGRWEADVREALRRRIGRGHVTVSIRTERAAAGRHVIDRARLGALVDELRGIRTEFGLVGDPDLGTLLRFPDVVVPAGEDEAPEATVEEVLGLVDAAVDALTAARDAEGARLAAVLEERLAIVEAALARIAARAPERLVAQRDRLRAAVRELADGVAVDEQRLAQEIAIQADRLDVAEELDRFASHIAAFRNALAAGSDEPVGKRLGFLLQEMLREANTTGSKAADAAILQDVIAIKEELERLREQVENVE